MSEKKKFRKFLETWHTFSAPKVIFLIFAVRRENFLMGLKMDFKFEILGILVQNPQGPIKNIRLKNLDSFLYQFISKKKFDVFREKNISLFYRKKIRLQLSKSGIFWLQKNFRKFLETSVIISL